MLSMTHSTVPHLYSEAAARTQPSAIREICKLIDSPSMKSLAGGWPDPQVFPDGHVSRIVDNLLATSSDRVLQYGTTEGVRELREELAHRAAEQDGIHCDPDQILITHGSAQAMDLACRVFVDPDDIVMVGLPTYFGGTGTITAHGGVSVGVPVDQDGLIVELLSAKLEALQGTGATVKAVYVIPNFQNPTGATLSLQRRRQLVELAEAHDLVLLEDDPYGELRFEGDPPPSLMALDSAGRVVHMRSMSKIFAPGLRLGWVAGDARVIRKMSVAKQFTDVATNSLAQYVLLEFVRRGFLDESIAHNRIHYQAKRDVMLQQLDLHFPKQVSWNRPSGGFFVFMRLPEGLDAQELLNEALEQDVAFVAGGPFFVDDSGENSLRLSYAQASEEDIEVAVARLGRLLRRRLDLVD